MKVLSRLLLIGLLAVGLTTGLSANGLNLNGTGAKSDAMGGAFVGLANDFSAAYWNPAGLAQLTKASFSLYGADILPTGTYALSAYGIDAKSVAKQLPRPGPGLFPAHRRPGRRRHLSLCPVRSRLGPGTAPTWPPFPAANPSSGTACSASSPLRPRSRSRSRTRSCSAPRWTSITACSRWTSRSPWASTRKD